MNSNKVIKAVSVFACAFALLSAPAQASGFDWLVNPGSIQTDTASLSLGATNYQRAQFPFSGLVGDLTDVGSVDFHIGAAPSVGFRIRGALRRSLKTDDSTSSATGDFSLTSTWKFLSYNDYSIGISLGMTLPNTNVQSGIGLDQGAQFGRLSLAIHKADVAIVMNSGIAIMNDPTRNTGQDDFFTFGFGISSPITERIVLAAEFYGIDGPDDGAEDGLFDSLTVALNTTVNLEKIFLKIRAAKYLADVAPDYSISFAVGTRFRYRR